MTQLLAQVLTVFSLSVAALPTRVFLVGFLTSAKVALKPALVTAGHFNGADVEAKGFFAAGSHDFFLPAPACDFDFGKAAAGTIVAS